jgi:hypothetical protein
LGKSLKEASDTGEVFASIQQVVAHSLGVELEGARSESESSGGAGGGAGAGARGGGSGGSDASNGGAVDSPAEYTDGEDSNDDDEASNDVDADSPNFQEECALEEQDDSGEDGDRAGEQSDSACAANAPTALVGRAQGEEGNSEGGTSKILVEETEVDALLDVFAAPATEGGGAEETGRKVPATLCAAPESGEDNSGIALEWSDEA